MFKSKQIVALKYMIFRSKDGNELSKQVLALLVDSSERLTKDVCLSLVADREGYTIDEISTVVSGVGEMQNSYGTTHINEILDVMGSKLKFSYHYGDFDPSRTDDSFNCDGQFAGHSESKVSRPGLVREGMPLRYTFWLSKDDYSRQATLVVATREDLEQINLKKPGLYPSLEPA